MCEATESCLKRRFSKSKSCLKCEEEVCTGGMVQVVEHQVCKYKSLNSNLNPTKNCEIGLVGTIKEILKSIDYMMIF
jgi:hypothetical protein